MILDLKLFDFTAELGVGEVGDMASIRGRALQKSDFLLRFDIESAGIEDRKPLPCSTIRIRRQRTRLMNVLTMIYYCTFILFTNHEICESRYGTYVNTTPYLYNISLYIWPHIIVGFVKKEKNATHQQKEEKHKRAAKRKNFFALLSFAVCVLLLCCCCCLLYDRLFEFYLSVSGTAEC